jgi:hypothetical protein
VLSMMENTTLSTETSLSTAFSDLEALMAKASEMVTLAADHNERLSASQTTAASSPLGGAGVGGGAIENDKAAFVPGSLQLRACLTPSHSLCMNMSVRPPRDPGDFALFEGLWLITVRLTCLTLFSSRVSSQVSRASPVDFYERHSNVKPEC